MVIIMETYNKQHKNAQVPSAQGLLDFASDSNVATVAIMELIIKSYGLQCQAKLGKPREFMLSKKSIKPLIDAAIKESMHLYGADVKKSPELVHKQAIYLLCGRDKSNKVKESCQTWRNALINKALDKKEAKPKQPKQPKQEKEAA